MSRFSLSQVIHEFEDQLARRGRGAQSRLCEALGWSRDYVSKRQSNVDYHWSIEDIGRVADFWEAPTDWPWISWDVAAARDKAWGEYGHKPRTPRVSRGPK